MDVDELKVDVDAVLDERLTKLEAAVLCLPELLAELRVIRVLLQESADRELRRAERAAEPPPKPRKTYPTMIGSVPAQG